MVVIAILILLFRRLPIVLLLKPVLPALKTYREASFAGWFGPMGVGAVFLSILAKEELEKVHGKTNPASVELISPIVLFIVLSSVLVHGTTIPMFQLGKRIHTRTLSIASSHNQVSRLPKLQFGQTLSFNRDDDARSRHSRDLEMSLSRTERNTLFNTPQERPRAGRQDQDSSGDNTVVPMDESQEQFQVVDMGGDQQYSDYDDLPDEEFLPNDDEDFDDNSYGIHPKQPIAASSDEQSTNKPTVEESKEKKSIPEGHSEPTRESSANEMSSIRFLEPVKPRSSTQASINVERNESSVTSLRGLFSKASREERDNMRASRSEQNAEPTSPEETETVPEQKRKKNAIGGFIPKTFRGLFEQPAAAGPSSSEKEGGVKQEMEEFGHEAPTPRIQVWEESHRVVIEDENDTMEPVIIEKSDPDWRAKAKETIAVAKRKASLISQSQENAT